MGRNLDLDCLSRWIVDCLYDWDSVDMKEFEPKPGDMVYYEFADVEGNDGWLYSVPVSRHRKSVVDRALELRDVQYVWKEGVDEQE